MQLQWEVLIFIGTISITIPLIFFYLLFIQYRRRRIHHIKEMKDLQYAYEQTLLKSQIEIQEQTLRHVSQELHDNIGQILSLVSLNLNTIAGSDQQRVSYTAGLVAKAMADLRSLSKSLNPDRINHIGLKDAIRHELLQLERTGKFKTHFSIDNPCEHLTSNQTIILYRMIQEVLNNIIKHANASEIIVNLTGNQAITTISITDNGEGFDPQIIQNNGLGLQNLRKRSQMISANMDIISQINAGTTVSFQIR